MERLDASCVREKDGKSFWTRLGVAFPTKSGGWTVLLDAMPAPVDGQYKIVLFPPKPKEETKTPDGSLGGDSIPDWN